MATNNERLHVLILEDDRADEKIIFRQLERSHFAFKTKSVTRLEDALEQLKHETFHAVVTDINLPDSSGIETIVKLKSFDKQLAILVLTSQEQEELEAEVRLSGAQDFRFKRELDSDSLPRAIMHAVQRQRDLNQMKHLARRLKRKQALLREQALQLKQKNRRLHKLYRTSREFVDNVSHDLRTPLTVIKDYVSIIREGMAGEVNLEQTKLLGKVALRADDLNHMVDDILDASKLEAGLLSAWRRPVPVSQIVSHAASLLQERAAIHGVQLVILCPDELPDAYCDIEKAVRVITNLAVNAIKFSKPGQSVRIWAKHCPIEGEIVLGVTDQGPGMDAESLARIFERFAQLNDHASSTVKGFGLGLNIAQRLTRINLGEMNVESEVGHGSTFTFTVPVADPAEVFSRWVQLHEQSTLPILAIKISVGETTSISDADDFDRFANCLLRKQDILFRICPRHWMLLLPIREKDIPRWEDRVARDFARFNRNRHQGASIGYARSIVHSWPPSTSRRCMQRDFEELLVRQFDQSRSDYLATS